MSVQLNRSQLNLINFFQLDATFNLITWYTHEVIRRSDWAQFKQQIVTVKEWKRQPKPINYGWSKIIWLKHDKDGMESRVVKQILKATPTTPLLTDYKYEL